MKFHYGKAIRKVDRLAGKVPVVGSAGTFSWHNEPNVLTDSSIIIGRKGTAGSVTWFNEPVWATDTSYWAEPTNGLDLKFLFLLLQHANLPGLTAQTGVPGLNRDRAYSADVLLAPLDEQRRIVDLIGTLDDAIEAASGVSRAAEQLVEELREHLFSPKSEWHETKLGDHLTKVSEPVSVVADATYTEIGIRSHGRGAFVKPPTTGTIIGKKRVFYVAPGQLVFNIVFAWEGAVAVLGPETEGMIASHRFPTFVSARAGGVDLIAHFLRTQQGKGLLDVCSPGGAGRNRTLNQKALMSSAVRLPPLEEWPSALGLLTAATRHSVACRDSEAALQALRFELLTVLLSGHHEIPSTYDEVMSAAV